MKDECFECGEVLPGREINSVWFCHDCGSREQRKCNDCGKPLDEWAEICAECMVRLVEEED